MFQDADEGKLELLQGSIIEHARLRCQLEELNHLAEKTGLVKFNPLHPQIHKTTPVFNALIKLRASYINSTRMLIRELGGNDDEFDEELEGFE